MKRFLAVLLCLVMLFSLAPLSVFAADEGEEAGGTVTEEEVAEFSAEEAYKAYSALETEEEKETYFATLTEEQQAELNEYIEGLFDVEKAYEEYSALETEEAKEAYLAELTEEQQAELNEYIEKLEPKVAASLESVAPVISLADKNVCRIGDVEGENEYASLAAAFKDAKNNDIITMIDDSEHEVVSATLSATNVVLNLNRHNITLETTARAFTITGSLTVNGEGTITDKTQCTSDNNGSIFYINGGTLTINGGSFARGESVASKNLLYSSNNLSSKIYIVGGSYSSNTFAEIISKGSAGSIEITGGNFTQLPNDYVNDGYFVSADSSPYVVISSLPDTTKATVTTSGTVYAYSEFTSAWAKVKVADQTSTLKLCSNIEFTEATTAAIYLNKAASVTLDLNGKAITNSVSKLKTVYVTAGSLTIKDSIGVGSITGNAAFESNGSALYAYNGGNIILEGGTINDGRTSTTNSAIYSYSKEDVVSTILITGGTVNGIIKKYSSGSVSITGGSFNNDPSSFVDTSAYIVTEENDTWSVSSGTGVVSVRDKSGNVTFYTDITDAYKYINGTLKGSSTVTLLEDITVAAQLKNSYYLTFDLKGHKITSGNDNTTNKRVFYAASKLTITDTSEGNSGCVDASLTGHYIAYVANSKEIVINGGNYISGVSSKNFGKDNSSTITVTLDTTKQSFFNNELKNITLPDGYKIVQVSDSSKSATPYTFTNTFATISYDVNGGIETEGYVPADQSDCAYLTGYTVNNIVTSQQPVKVGAKFTKWTTGETGTGTSFTSGSYINIAKVKSRIDTSGVLTLYAQWDTSEKLTKVAQINDDTSKQYYTVMEALYNAENNDTIKLLADISDETIRVVSGKVVTLDLNGKSIDTSSKIVGSAITNAGTLTITGNGSIKGVAKNTGGGIDNSGTLTIESGSINGTAPSYGGGIYNNGTVTMNGGTVDGTAASGGAVYTTKGTFIMNGGTVSGTVSNADNGSSFYVSNYSYSHLIINGTSIVNGTINALGSGKTSYRDIVVTEGTFKTYNPSEFVDTNKSSVTGAGTEANPYIVSLKIIPSYVISVCSRISGTDQSIANVSGGGSIASTDSTTLCAPSVAGYTFKGWYKDYTASDIGTQVTSDSMYLVSNPTADASYYAVYEGTSSKFNLKVTCSDFKYKIEDGDWITVSKASDPTTVSGLSAAAKITIVCNADNFLYWKNASDKVVSKGNEEYSFIMGSNVTLTAVSTGTVETTSALVVFRSDYGQIVQAGTYTYTTETPSITIPFGPSKLGYTFNKWVFENTDTEATAESINNKISESQGKMYIVPSYEEITTTYTVTVDNVDANGTIFDAQIYKSVRIGDSQTVTAPAVDGKYFQYWSDKSSSGNILSYDTEYTVRPTANTVVYAIYGISKVQEENACLNIVNQRESTDTQGTTTKDKCSFTEYYSLPDEYSLVKVGYLYTKGDKYSTTDLVIDSTDTDVKNAISKMTANSGTFTINLNFASNAAEAETVYVRGYVQYKPTSGDTVYTLYTDIIPYTHQVVSAT